MHLHAQTNAAGQRLECSHFRPAQVASEAEPLPIVVYCHCNSGSRRDAEEAALVLLPHHISVFALDFAVRQLTIWDVKGIWRRLSYSLLLVACVRLTSRCA